MDLLDSYVTISPLATILDDGMPEPQDVREMETADEVAPGANAVGAEAPPPRAEPLEVAAPQQPALRPRRTRTAGQRRLVLYAALGVAFVTAVLFLQRWLLVRRNVTVFFADALDEVRKEMPRWSDHGPTTAPSGHHGTEEETSSASQDPSSEHEEPAVWSESDEVLEEVPQSRDFGTVKAEFSARAVHYDGHKGRVETIFRDDDGRLVRKVQHFRGLPFGETARNAGCQHAASLIVAAASLVIWAPLGAL